MCQMVRAVNRELVSAHLKTGCLLDQSVAQLPDLSRLPYGMVPRVQDLKFEHGALFERPSQFERKSRDFCFVTCGVVE
jgi:hypothetical protein